MRILILDDEPWHVEWIQDFCENLGANVTIVSSLEDAISFCEMGFPDLAIIDIRIGYTGRQLSGEAFKDIPDEWEGLKFAHYIRVDSGVSINATKIFIYTVLDDENLETPIVKVLSGKYFTKNDTERFRDALEELVTSD